MQLFSKEYYEAQKEFNQATGDSHLSEWANEIDMLAKKQGIRPYTLGYKAPAPYYMSAAYDNQWSHTRDVSIEKRYGDITVIIRANRYKWGYKATFPDGRELSS